jgi:hypothetical protein
MPRGPKRLGRGRPVDVDWVAVFEARCASKEGRTLSDEERVLCDAAFEADRARYAAMERDVFNATVPFGSCERWR